MISKRERYNMLSYPDGRAFEEDDMIKLSGYCLTNHRIFTDIVAIIATVDKLDGCIKVWPDEENDVNTANQLTSKEIYHGKLWFELHDITDIQLLHRD